MPLLHHHQSKLDLLHAELRSGFVELRQLSGGFEKLAEPALSLSSERADKQSGSSGEGEVRGLVIRRKQFGAIVSIYVRSLHVIVQLFAKSL